MNRLPLVDNVLRIYNDRAEWVATLAYGSAEPTDDAIRAKIAEYNGAEALFLRHVDGEWQSTSAHAL